MGAYSFSFIEVTFKVYNPPRFMEVAFQFRIRLFRFMTFQVYKT